MTKCWCGAPVKGNSCSGSSLHNWKAAPETKIVRKLYLAGPMSGLPDCNYPTFNYNAKLLEEAGYTVVNPAQSQLSEAYYTDFLREDLRLLLDCDGVATLKRWEGSVGARNEVMVAGVLGMPVNTVGYWLATAPPEEEQTLF